MIKLKNVWDKNKISLSRSFMHQLVATFTCNLGVLAAGPCFTWLEPLTKTFTDINSEIQMSKENFAWLTASVEFGELVGVIPSGILADRWGRKTVILLIGPLCTISWIIVAFTRDVLCLYIVRFLQGVALAIVFTVVPMYIAEISSPNVRGSLGGQFTVFWFLGILFSYGTGHYLGYQSYIFSQLSLPILFFFTFLLMPESPYYYFMKKNTDKGKKSLTWLRCGEDIVDECNKIEKAIEEDMRHKGSWKDLIATKSDRRALFIVQIVSFVRYMTGMPVFISYASDTFAGSTEGVLTSDQLTIIMGVILCASAFFSSLFSDTVGRRPLMISSAVGVFVFNAILAIYYYLDKNPEIDMSSVVWIMYIGVAGFCISINMGIGQLMQTVQAEFFPSHTRGLGGGVTGITTSITTFINLILYQTLNDQFGIYMNFLTFSLFSLIGTFLIMKFLTESAGKSLAEININIKEITS